MTCSGQALLMAVQHTVVVEIVMPVSTWKFAVFMQGLVHHDDDGKLYGKLYAMPPQS